MNSIFLTNRDNVSFVYNSIADLQDDSDNLIDGQYVLCLGYNDISDGCRTAFRIVKKDYNEGEVNYYIPLGDNLKAELVIENNTINILQLGGKPVQYIDGTNGTNGTNVYTDNKPAFNRYLDLIKNKKNGVAVYKLYIPSGIWCTSPIDINTAVNIEGSHPTMEGLHSYGGTTITTMPPDPIPNGIRAEQSHVFAIRPFFNPDAPKEKFDKNGDYIYKADDQAASQPKMFTLKNIIFSSGVFEYKDNKFSAVGAKNMKITHSALRLHNATFGIFENIGFRYVLGRCITIKTCWELRFLGNLNVIECCNISDDGLIVFNRVDSKANGYHTDDPNISNIEIYNINIEAVFGHIFRMENHCRLMDTLIQNIHIEPNRTSWLFYALGNYYTTTTPTSESSLGIFDIKGSCKMIINNIIINNISMRKWASFGGKTYRYSTIFRVADTPTETDPSTGLAAEKDGISLCVDLGTIMIQGMDDNCNIIKTYSAKLNKESYFILDSVGLSSSKKTCKCIFNVQNFPNIICNGKIDNFANNGLSSMSNSFNACYKNVFNSDMLDGYLHYDADSLNDLKLVVKPKNGATNPFMMLPIRGSKLCISAKITENLTYKLCIHPTNTSENTPYVFDLVGTGCYKLYELDITTIINHAEIILNKNTENEKHIPIVPMVELLTSSDMVWKGQDVALDLYYFKD